MTLRTKIDGVRRVELKDLTIEERILLGRYHALRFGNCTKSESRNRTRGAMVAGSLALMANSPFFGDFTVGEYLAKAAEYHEVADRKPWFRPWDIKALCGPDVLDRSRNGAGH